MKVGLVIYGSLEILTGGFIYDRKLVEHIQAQGDQVELFALPWRDYASHLTDNLSYRFLKRLLNADCDLLLQDELNHPSLLLANLLLDHSAHFPIVSIVHHLRCSELRSSLANHFYKILETTYLRSVDGFVFNSDTTRASLGKSVLGKKPGVIAYPGRGKTGSGINSDFIRKRAEEPGPLRLLFVGSIIPRKELHTLLEALSHIPRKEWVLRVVGSPEADKDYSKQIQECLKRFRLEDNVTLLGSMSREELDIEYRNSHALAVPSSYEGFGMVYMEAMGFGVPPMASTAGAAREMITDAENGFLVAPGDVKSISDKIGSVCADRMLLVDMGLAALDRFQGHPTWEQSCDRIYNFMKEMVLDTHV